MRKEFNIYKGLQKPLIYRGFQGKFIAWGLASLLISLFAGGIIGTMTNMLLGGIICIGGFTGGLFFTLQQQKGGLHYKTRHTSVFEFRTDFKKLRNGTKT